MKKTLLILLLIITGFCFAQTYNHILIDKLTFTINDLEISGGFDSATTLNWKANLTVKGLEMQYEDQKFKEFANNITDGDEIIIDQFKATISMFNNVLKISNAKFSSPFLKADIKAEMLIDVNNPGDTWIKSSTIKLNVLSNVLERYVFEIEKELGQALPRKGKSIVIEASGPLGNPRIKDMDKE